MSICVHILCILYVISHVITHTCNMCVQRHDSTYRIQVKLQSVHPEPFMGRPLPGPAPHPSPMRAAPPRRLRGVRPAPSYPRVLPILLLCSSHCLLPVPPPKDFQVHLNVVLSVGLFPPGAEPLFLPAGFRVPFCKPHSSNSALILYPSCFYKDLSFQPGCEVPVGGATSCPSSDCECLTQGLQSSW